MLSIRACDGTYRDHNFARNYAWVRTALDAGRLTFGIVYTYVRPATWKSNAETVQAMFAANGRLHPRVSLMLDVESGGNPGGGHSDPINRLWPTKPDGIRLIIAAYGANPPYPGKVAHQYTDGRGYGGGLPEGCPPFGRCDMNSADGLTPQQFPSACGIAPAQGPPGAPAEDPRINL